VSERRDNCSRLLLVGMLVNAQLHVLVSRADLCRVWYGHVHGSGGNPLFLVFSYLCTTETVTA